MKRSKVNALGIVFLCTLLSFYPSPCVFAGNENQGQEKLLANHEVERLAGEDRFQTMLQVALKFNPGKTQNVILTTGYDFPDAIAAVPLAKQKSAPILLVNRTPEESREALSYVQDHVNRKGNVYLLGGPAVISEAFVPHLTAMGFNPENIHRVAGKDRYETSVKIAELMEHEGSEYYLASGDSFADALSASALAANALSALDASAQKTREVPILLVPSRKAVPESVLNYITHGDKESSAKQTFHIVGGPGAVPENSIEQLRKVTNAETEIIRISGSNRYETMKLLNSQGGFLDNSRGNDEKKAVIPILYLASGENFPDALTGAVLAAKDNAPLVLINESMPKSTLELLSDFYHQNQKGTNKDTKIVVLGGTGVISNQAVTNVDYVFNYNGSLTDQAKVLTRAGSGRMGYRDGTDKESEFAFPMGVLEGKDGTLYISDTMNHVIRALSPEGKVTTFAGKIQGKDQYGLRVGGFRDGSLSEALFNHPKGLAMDNAGNIYVADTGNGAIRVLGTNGQVRTLISGLESPTDLVLAADGILYVSETLNHRLLKVLSNGTMTVLAGGGYEIVDGLPQGGFADGIREKAKFNEPTGLALGPDGTLYVVDTGNQRVRAVASDGTVTTVAGSGTELIEGTSYLAGGYQNGPADKAQFNFPSGIAAGQDGTLYVADTYNHRLRVIRPNGQVETLAGNGHHGKQNGYLRQAEFDGPTGLCLSQAGSLMVVDQLGNLIRQVQLK